MAAGADPRSDEAAEMEEPAYRVALVAPSNAACSLSDDKLAGSLGTGGAAAGWRTVLVTDFGLLRGRDIAADILATGITPDFIVARP
ncbi:MAG: hypothetical protein O7B25_03590 [Gammaproteobacteria bacterium]|nr:hypothetical protein [Gammaproteobacteria bacterium]